KCLHAPRHSHLHLRLDEPRAGTRRARRHGRDGGNAGLVGLVDLSVPIRPDPPEYPDVLRTEIEFESHVQGAEAIRTLFGVEPELLRDGEGWTTETFLRFGTHNSTHVDAPWPYNSTIQGKPARTIDQLPLEWFYAPGVIIEARDRADG